MSKLGKYERTTQVCPTCGKECKGKAALANHIKTHKEAKNEPQTDTYKPTAQDNTLSDAGHSNSNDEMSDNERNTESKGEGEELNEDTNNDGQSHISNDGLDEIPQDLCDSGGIETTETQPADVRQVPNTPPVSVDNKTIGTIQIIGEDTKKEDKEGLADKVFEFMTSEQMQPITSALLAGVANYLNGNINRQQQDGHIVETVGGGKIQVLNPNF